MNDPKDAPVRYSDEANLEPVARASEVTPDPTPAPILTEEDGTEWFVAAPEDGQGIEPFLVVHPTEEEIMQVAMGIALADLKQMLRRFPR